MADLEFTVRYEDVEDGWVMATVPGVPGVVTQGATVEEARMMVLDALQLILEAHATDAQNVPGKVTTENLAFTLTG
jgi:antitoxin HicB